MNIGLIFKNVDPNNKKEVIEKGLEVAKLLRLFAVLAIIGSLIVAIPLVLGAGILGGVGVATSEPDVATASAVAGGFTAAGLAGLLLVIGMAGQIISLWYTGKLKKQLENNEVPGKVFPIIFLVIALSSIYSSITPKLNIIAIICYLFVAYLWFVILGTISKLDTKA